MDKVLKQRLVGAAILIALAVIFVPMLFDGSDRREGPRDASIDLPPPPADRREVRRLPLDPGAASEPRQAEPADSQPVAEPEEIDSQEPAAYESPAESAAPVTEPPVPMPQPEPESEPEAELDPEPEPEPAPETPEPTPQPTPETTPGPQESAAPAGSWQVQVASFGSAATAERITSQLEQLGHAANTDLLVRGETRLHRVSTGPYADREAADRARAQIAATVAGVEPLVREIPGAGDEASPSPARSGFAVQVGSFAEESNADRQMNQLLDRGFDAFIHADETGSRSIWRVRVGTVATREEASALQRTLREQAGLEGLVVSHP
ncbi:SPOR domain-containing protein [Wenzhouxiangella limi]|uniref:SPOR domain-containing protein n=1 Tax=Wenzhouxiangella limi TaxID=2707351 RepID=A0A845V375_9GAMM|nr:SPOR domain-containing protein [Wenzhouxiangella limi]NDY96720.1 hypothetical protein [Wenzhouxiangella limi]